MMIQILSSRLRDARFEHDRIACQIRNGLHRIAGGKRAVKT